MKLQLQRPIAFIDIESTGTNRESDRIIEISICKLHVNGDREIKTRRVNPLMLIPPASTEIHGITDEDVKDAPPFGSISKGLLEFLEGCDVGGFNSNVFDIPLLFNEFLRNGHYWDYTTFKMIDAGNIFKIKEPRTLSAAYKFYCNKELTDAHNAESDINATVDVFLSQVERYEDVPTTVDELHLYCNYGKPFLDLSGKFSYNEAGDIILNFAKYKGEKASDHIDFIEWMYYKASFPEDTRKICEQVLEIAGVEEDEDDEDWYNMHVVE